MSLQPPPQPQPPQQQDTSVTKQDQENICNFAILADDLRVIKAEIKRLEEYRVLLSDAQDEAMLAHADGSEDAAFFRLGDCFLRMTEEGFEQQLGKELQASERTLEQSKAKLVDTHTAMVALKTELYAKFKDQISLEFE